METKLARTLLFGASGTGKTFNTGETWPTPILFLQFDPNGTDCIRTRKVVTVDKATLTKQLQDKEFKWPDVTVLNCYNQNRTIMMNQFRSMSGDPASMFADVTNKLFQACPFKTVVLDSWTSFDQALMEFLLCLQGKQSMEIQHYGQLSGKKWEIVSALNTLPCNTVVIGHEITEKDELTGEIRIIPAGVGAFQQSMGLLFSQVLYATTERTPSGEPKYVVYTAPKGLVKGLKMRFPAGVPVVCEHNYTKLFGGK